MAPKIILYICLLHAFGCGNPEATPRHVFYLHGAIVEIQGPKAVSDKFGAYQYQQILDSLEVGGVMVHSEVRHKDTDFDAFTRKVSGQIDSLLRTGVAPENITVIGASKGGLMAMAISHLNKNPVNYILLGANNTHTEQSFDWQLHGNVLGIYEASDDIGDRDYSYWMERSPEALRFEQLQLNTGLGHGFLYRPIDAWLGPARSWMSSP